MAALIILSLIYAGVLVVALAVSLTLIWIALRRTGKLLAEVSQALSTVRTETGSLEAHLERLKEPCAQCAEELTQVEDALACADERLRALVQPADNMTAQPR